MLDHKKDYKAWLYIGLPVLVLLVFTFYPIINTVLISFFSAYDQTTQSFGPYFNFMAYQRVLTNTVFLTALTNTLIIVAISVPITTVLSLLIAVFLNSIKPLQKTFQLIFFLPYVTNTLALGMVFAVMFRFAFQPELGGDGLINSLFGLRVNWVDVGASRSNWMFVVIMYSVWNGLAFRILVFVGGLQSIGKQYYDAAKIDSASPRRVLMKITIPLLSPILAYIIITSFIGAFQTSESVLAVAGGNPRFNGLVPEDNARMTMVHFILRGINDHGSSFGVSNYSMGAAGAVILFLIILFMTGINLYVSKKRVHF